MAMQSKTYQRVASSLWILAGILLGLTASVYFDASLKGRLFLVVLGVGAVLLFRLNASRVSSGKTQKLLAAGEPGLWEAKAGAVTKDTAFKPAPQASAGEIEVLSGAQAREWLDDFLVQQQRRDN